MVTRMDDELVGLPSAARRLGLHRATVNEMVQSGRVPATRVGAHWFITRRNLEAFAASYSRPRNAPLRNRGKPLVAPEILSTLAEWDDATVAELAVVIDMHEGNIRKHLCFAEADGLARRDDFGRWSLTPAGRARV